MVVRAAVVSALLRVSGDILFLIGSILFAPTINKNAAGALCFLLGSTCYFTSPLVDIYIHYTQKKLHSDQQQYQDEDEDVWDSDSSHASGEQPLVHCSNASNVVAATVNTTRQQFEEYKDSEDRHSPLKAPTEPHHDTDREYANATALFTASVSAQVHLHGASGAEMDSTSHTETTPQLDLLELGMQPQEVQMLQEQRAWRQQLWYLIVGTCGGLFFMIGSVMLLSPLIARCLPVGLSFFICGCISFCVSFVPFVVALARQLQQAHARLWLVLLHNLGIALDTIFSIVGNLVIIVGCIMFMPSFSLDVSASDVFLVGSVSFIVAGVGRLLAVEAP
eukprot:m.260806 g.260806  ORF g.260806 m.260806 type:complete len:335 (+) comp15566_c0_seq1:109-1113(+)